jgi:hypothetical protein
MASIGVIGELAVPQPELPGVTYLFLFLIAGGLFCPFTSIVTLVGNNLAPSSKRAVELAILASFGNMGGVCGSNIYLARQAPQYPVGYGTCLGACVAGIGAAILLQIAYASENRKKAALLQAEDEAAVRARYREQELVDLGDKSPFFSVYLVEGGQRRALSESTRFQTRRVYIPRGALAPECQIQACAAHTYIYSTETRPSPPRICTPATWSIERNNQWTIFATMRSEEKATSFVEMPATASSRQNSRGLPGKAHQKADQRNHRDSRKSSSVVAESFS